MIRYFTFALWLAIPVLNMKYLSLLISALLVFLFLRGTSPHEIISACQDVHIRYLFAALPFLFLCIFFKTLRWHALLSIYNPRVRKKSVLQALTIGTFLDQILPAKMSEFARAYILGRNENIPKPTVLSTVIIERAADILIILSGTSAVIFFAEINHEIIKKLQIAGGLILAVCCAGIVVFIVFNTTLISWFKFISVKIVSNEKTQYLCELLNNLYNGFLLLKGQKKIVHFVVFSLCMWISVCVNYYFFLRTFDFGAAVPAYTVFILLLFVTFATAIPSAPGGIGVIEYASFLAVQVSITGAESAALYSVPALKAFSILFRIFQNSIETGFGIYYFSRLKIKIWNRTKT